MQYAILAYLIHVKHDVTVDILSVSLLRSCILIFSKGSITISILNLARGEENKLVCFAYIALTAVVLYEGSAT